MAMTRLPLLLLLVPAGLSAQAIAPGEWTGRLTVREIVAPGVPGFLLRMARGKSRTERKCISPVLAATGPVALLAPDPKANCTVASQHLANGRYDQVLMCPQKKGPPLRIDRTGRYDVAGLVGQVAMNGNSDRGAFRFVGAQTVMRTGATCR
jgi:hypothetical protein